MDVVGKVGQEDISGQRIPFSSSPTYSKSEKVLPHTDFPGLGTDRSIKPPILCVLFWVILVAYK